MYKFYVNGANSHAFKTQSACADIAKLVSAVHRTQATVFDMDSGEVLQKFDTGLEIINLKMRTSV